MSGGPFALPRTGFPDMNPGEFMRRYFVDAQGIGLMDDVTRIEWRYLDVTGQGKP